eukprot:3837141-Pyramimonas_sp.AAC.1
MKALSIVFSRELEQKVEHLHPRHRDLPDELIPARPRAHEARFREVQGSEARAAPHDRALHAVPRGGGGLGGKQARAGVCDIPVWVDLFGFLAAELCRAFDW